MTNKKPYEEVYNYFKECGCLLLEDTYINGRTKMKYRCSCGNIAEICYDKFQQKRRCRVCQYERIKSCVRSNFRWRIY